MQNFEEQSFIDWLHFFDESLEKAEPVTPKYAGQAHPSDARLIATQLSGRKLGDLVWDFTESQKRQHDNNAQSKLGSILKYVPKTHQSAYANLVVKVLSDPNRYLRVDRDHNIPGETPSIRMRHLANAAGNVYQAHNPGSPVKGEPGYEMSFDEGGITLKAPRHGAQKRTDVWFFDGKNLTYKNPEKLEESEDLFKTDADFQVQESRKLANGLHYNYLISHSGNKVYLTLSKSEYNTDPVAYLHGETQGKGKNITIEGHKYDKSTKQGLLKLLYMLALLNHNKVTNNMISPELDNVYSFLNLNGAKTGKYNILGDQKLYAQLSPEISPTWHSRIFGEALSKSFAPKSWNRIKRSHNTEASQVVDAMPHIQESQNKIPEGYKKLIEDPKPAQDSGIDTGGISAKMVHDLQPYSGIYKDNVMTKPYHRKPESHTKSWVKDPIMGWATMANRALYEAGNVGHLCENVAAHEHNGIPVIVHMFNPQARPVGSMHSKTKYNAKDKYIIQLFDFLTNNLDRHCGNLLAIPHPTGGPANLLAIDHERSFQYDKTLSHSPDGSMSFMKSSNDYLHRYSGRAMRENVTPIHNSTPEIPGYDYNAANEVADWWMGNKDNILNTLEKNLSYIKDETVRNHIRDNFKQRWDSVTDYMDDMSRNDASNFDNVWQMQGADHGISASFVPKPRKPRLDIRNISKTLNQKDPSEAIELLAEITKRTRSDDVKQSVGELLHETFNRMTPEQFANEFKKHYTARTSVGDKGFTFAALHHALNQLPNTLFFSADRATTPFNTDKLKALYQLHQNPDSGIQIPEWWLNRMKEHNIIDKLKD